MDVIPHRCRRCLLARPASGSTPRSRSPTPAGDRSTSRSTRLTSHHAWSGRRSRPRISLGPGGDGPVSARRSSPSPTRGPTTPCSSHVRARTPDGAQATASASITPRRDAPPVAPVVVWPLPDELLGGLDVASLALGAVTVPIARPDRGGRAPRRPRDRGDSGSRERRVPAGDPDGRPRGRPSRSRSSARSSTRSPAAECPAMCPSSFELLLSSDGVTYTPRARRRPQHADGRAGVRARCAGRGDARAAAAIGRPRRWLRAGVGSASGRSSRRRASSRPASRGHGCGRHGLRPRAQTGRRPRLLDRPQQQDPTIAGPDGG